MWTVVASAVAPVLLFFALLALVATAAGRWGGWAERTAAALYVVAAVATALLREHGPTRYDDVAITSFVIDMALLAGLLVIVVKVDRWWPIVSAALQLLTVSGHVAKLTDTALPPMAYFMTQVASSFPSLALLAVGVWTHRRARNTSAGSWRRAAPPRPERPPSV